MYKLEEISEETRRAKAKLAFNSMRSQAEAAGFMSDEEIEVEIQAAREAMASQQS